jgi:Holliday junction resolvase-like predicted endonuclease
MALSKTKGDLAEMLVAADLLRRGYRVAFPYGEDADYDLILDRGTSLERVQVKHCRSDGRAIEVKCRSHSLTNGRVRAVKRCTAASIDWLAVYDPTSDRCYYLPASLLGAGRATLNLRLDPPRNAQRLGVHLASDYLEI